ncbi:bile acid:sodium symporter family protein [Niveispirillum cyanobacteriorum]|uniref:Bile acid:sodium symporter n=1 Tax=Niveispirillum cyanobacteriorum TaxID=1612173 RepID=A0A2K9N9B6_9PROT|nr:bile acid:sodium symporter family protein [Niveispirillum cyanobacteriorum]AUN29679.1 bile acid:sodium symporter [Niveispirillum cyanobacteriorum]GGE61916.1 bile acid:sodium symporter [Niveispirillum cyanobacteriorum]
MKRFLEAVIDPFLLALLATVGLAALFPAQGQVAGIVDIVADIAIALLFFFHGAKLSREAILAGMGHWRLHLSVLASTFVLFPLLGLAAGLLPASILPTVIATGILYLCLLPSTVQSSIAFVSIAGGNVPAAICSASASNLLGIFITPLLVGLLMKAGGQAGISLAALEAIILQLLVPFIAGHLARPLIGRFVQKYRNSISYTDRGSILLVVYSAFSAAVVEGLWHKVAASDLIAIAVASIVLLALVMGITALAGRWFGFNRADRIVLLFCGSKKSLVSGVPMASVLFPVAQVGLIILPLMLFHQIQLIICTWLAARWRQEMNGTEP